MTTAGKPNNDTLCAKPLKRTQPRKTPGLAVRYQFYCWAGLARRRPRLHRSLLHIPTSCQTQGHSQNQARSTKTPLNAANLTPKTTPYPPAGDNRLPLLQTSHTPKPFLSTERPDNKTRLSTLHLPQPPNNTPRLSPHRPQRFPAQRAPHCPVSPTSLEKQPLSPNPLQAIYFP